MTTPPWTRIGLALGLCTVSEIGYAEVGEAEWVAGETLIAGAGAVEEVIESMGEQPVAKEEVDRFLAEAETVLAWSEKNVERWRAADAADRPLDVIRAFDVWSGIDSSASAFVATLVKLMIVRTFSSQPVSSAGLAEEIAEMERIVKSGNLSGYVLEMARREIAEKRRALRFLQSVAPGNQKLYKARRERIDSILDRFERIGD